MGERTIKEMSDVSSPARRPGSVGGLANNEHLSILLVTGGILLALALAVALLRFQRLGELPAGIHLDEGAHGVDALHVLQGEHAVYFPGNYGREGLIVYTIALTTSFLGRTIFAVRAPSALASAGTVFVIFWLGWLFFGRDESGRATPWRGLLVGGAGAGLLAVSLGQTIVGRTALRGNFLPLLLSLCLALLWSGWPKPEQGRVSSGAPFGSVSTGHSSKTENQRVCRAGVWWRIALAGVCAGLLPYTYIPARFTPFLFLLFGLSFLLTWGSKRERGESKESSSRSFGFSLNTSRLRTELPWAGVFLGVAGLVAAPILIHFALHPEHFFVRIEAVWFLRENQGTPLEILLNNVWKHLSVFGFFGGRAEWYGFSGQPLLNSWEGVFFWLGAGTAAWRWQQPAYRLLLLWLGVLVLPAMLALDTGQEPSTLRLIGAVPAVYLLIGVGMWEVFRVLRQRWGALSRGGHPIFPGFNAWVPIVLGGVACALILGQGIVTYFTYFERWATAPEVNETYEGVWTELAKTLNAQPSDEETVYLLPFRYGEHYSFDYLYQGKMSTDVVRGNIPSLPQEIESSVAAVENVHTVKLVDWNNDSISGDAYAEEHIAVLLDKYGRYLGSDEYADFQIHTYTDVALGRPWTLYDQLEPLTVEYDGGIALHGFALGQGREQLLSEQLLTLREDRSLWMALRWQLAPGLDIDYAISLRLHDAGGGGVYQKDLALWEPGHTPTGSGESSAQFDTLAQLDLPADLQPGEYELRLVVYDAETLKPTVELGVWEAETTLARLRLAED